MDIAAALDVPANGRERLAEEKNSSGFHGLVGGWLGIRYGDRRRNGAMCQFCLVKFVPARDVPEILFCNCTLKTLICLYL